MMVKRKVSLPPRMGIQSLIRTFNKRPLRFTLVLAFCFILFVCLFSHPTPPIVNNLHLFPQTPTHEPPTQHNRTNGEVRWHSDWKWLRPFSASISLDEDLSVLPPSQDRTPIYTFYDAEEEKSADINSAENALLLLWRRAWWAQGFRPVILGPKEASQNLLYAKFTQQELQPQIKADLMRWLAWGHMGTGILANWLVFPMGYHDEQIHSFLRAGKFSKITQFEGLGGGLYCGEASAIRAAISEALASPTLNASMMVTESLSHSHLHPDVSTSAIAFYNASTNAAQYPGITAKLAESKAKGLRFLAQLINSHLHLTFHNAFPNGFAVLTPCAEDAIILSQASYDLAKALSSCPDSPIPSSCPPNNRECRPCSSTIPITTPQNIVNQSRTYLIGNVPHPHTLASLKAKTKEITTSHIRRHSPRDPWLDQVTERILGKEIGGQGRIVGFKDMVASIRGRATSLWMTEDIRLDPKDMEFHFGFSLPTYNTTPLADYRLPTDDVSPHKDHKETVRLFQLQHDLLESSRELLQGGKGGEAMVQMRTKQMVEAWNLADTEAWRFVRALAAREKSERREWEKAEKGFAGSEDHHSERLWKWFNR